jgi:hypothetical protein
MAQTYMMTMKLIPVKTAGIHKPAAGTLTLLCNEVEKIVLQHLVIRNKGW